MSTTSELYRVSRLKRVGSMRAALDDEVGRLERLIARIWQVLAAAGVIFGAIVGLAVPGPLGWTAAALCVAFVVWFTFLGRAIASDRSPALRRFVAPIIEGMMPWVFLGVIMETQGPVHAVGSWVPPLLFTALMVASIARLRPVSAIVLGFVSAAAFLVAYFALIRPKLDPALLAQPFYGPRLQVTRALSLAVGGIFCAAITHGLLAAIGRAQKVVRAQDLFGKYRLEKKIASGGMGVVYAATYCPEGGFERPVAVKVIHEHLAEQPSFVDGFRHEAELSARLVHANIVQVFDFGRVEETYFLAMEFVDGLTLRELLRRLSRGERKLPLNVVAWIGHEILAGLAYGHTVARDPSGALLRVVHRDLSPVNILVSKSGEVKISDYGVAKALREARASTTTTLAGHLAYMAPEQARSQPIDERADLFVAGVLIWEVLTGRSLFRRGEDAATFHAVLTGSVPPPSERRDDLGPGWDKFFLRALEREPLQRFQTAVEMAAALASFAPRTACAEELSTFVAWALELPDTGDAPTITAEPPTRVERRA